MRSAASLFVHRNSGLGVGENQFRITEVGNGHGVLGPASKRGLSSPLRALTTPSAFRTPFSSRAMKLPTVPWYPTISCSVAFSAPSAMPYLLSFAAGAMIYVVVEELIPEMSSGEHSNIGVLLFSFGFTLMMVLDVALS